MALRMAAALHGLGSHGWAHFFRERCSVGTQSICREKNHPLGQVSILMQHEGIQIWTGEARHTQVTREDIITMGLKLG